MAKIQELWSNDVICTAYGRLATNGVLANPVFHVSVRYG
jgi:hypothetical protein